MHHLLLHCGQQQLQEDHQEVQHVQRHRLHQVEPGCRQRLQQHLGKDILLRQRPRHAQHAPEDDHIAPYQHKADPNRQRHFDAAAHAAQHGEQLQRLLLCPRRRRRRLPVNRRQVRHHAVAVPDVEPQGRQPDVQQAVGQRVCLREHRQTHAQQAYANNDQAYDHCDAQANRLPG
jgi:hypothetical protein